MILHEFIKPGIRLLDTATLTATNGVGPDDTQAFTLNVQQAPVITSSPLNVSLPDGAPYSFAYQASGYPAPTFTLTSGTLPPGLEAYRTSGGTIEPNGASWSLTDAFHSARPIAQNVDRSVGRSIENR